MNDTDAGTSSIPAPGATSDPAAVRIRPATIADLEILAHHRIAMYRDMGALDEAYAEQLRRASLEYFRQTISSGRYHAWVAVADGEIVAGAGLSIEEVPPRPGAHGLNPGPDGLVLNVYTEPAWRGRGLASRLVREILAWARERGIERVNLHASDDGRPVYERIGFVPTNEMRYTISDGPPPKAR